MLHRNRVMCAASIDCNSISSDALADLLEDLAHDLDGGGYLCCALGDALGTPAKDWLQRYIRNLFGRHDRSAIVNIANAPEVWNVSNRSLVSGLRLMVIDSIRRMDCNIEFEKYHDIGCRSQESSTGL